MTKPSHLWYNIPIVEKDTMIKKRYDARLNVPCEKVLYDYVAKKADEERTTLTVIARRLMEIGMKIEKEKNG